MKCRTIIDENCEEQVLIYARQKTALTDAIEQLILENEFVLNGYINTEIVRLSVADICCFIVEGNKVFALTEKEKLQLKTRLYKIEEKLPANFVKINQSCIANIKKIEKFNVAFSGALSVKFKNGYTDYVSRRNLKKVKERLGL